METLCHTWITSDVWSLEWMAVWLQGKHKICLIDCRVLVINVLIYFVSWASLRSMQLHTVAFTVLVLSSRSLVLSSRSILLGNRFFLSWKFFPMAVLLLMSWLQYPYFVITILRYLNCFTCSTSYASTNILINILQLLSSFAIYAQCLGLFHIYCHSIIFCDPNYVVHLLL